MTQNKFTKLALTATTALLALGLVACTGTQQQPTVAAGSQCGQLGADGQEVLAHFYEPGAVVSAKAVKQRVFHARAIQPNRTMGAKLTVRAESDMNAPYLHRVLSCHAASADSAHPNDPLHPEQGKVADISVKASGAGYTVEVTADNSKAGEEIYQRAKAMSQGSVQIEQVAQLDSAANL